MAPPSKRKKKIDVEAEVANQPNKYNWKLLSIDEQQIAIKLLIDESEDFVESAAIELKEARELASKAGLSIETSNTSLATPADSTYMPVAPVATTGGYSNTDHVVLQTGDPVTDRIEELKRNQWIRTQQSQRDPELTLQKWDKQKEAGGRRRRVAREHPDAPFEPPPSGYIIFLGQMTTKIRHERPNARHNQAEIMPEISKMWRKSLSADEQKFYNDVAEKIRVEFKKQHMEFRATGSFTPSDNFERKGSFWTHKKQNKRNALEHELDSYETIVFPPRPPEYDEEYFRRERDSKRRRRLKEKGVDRDEGVDGYDEDWTEADPKSSEVHQDVDDQDEDWTEADPKSSRKPEGGIGPRQDMNNHDEDWTEADPKSSDAPEFGLDPYQDMDNHDWDYTEANLKSSEAPEEDEVEEDNPMQSCEV